MTDKGLNLLDGCAARSLYLFLRKRSAPLLPEGTLARSHLAPSQTHWGSQLKQNKRVLLAK